MLQCDMCAGSEFKHCYQDDVTGSDFDTVSLLQDSCGFTDSQKVSLYSYMWQITSKQTLWIDVLKFSLHFIDYPCSVEYMRMEDIAIENLYCGSRVPWEYYSISSRVNVSFSSNIYLPNKGEFQIFFREGKHVRHTKHILQVALTNQKHILFYNAKHVERQFLYFIAHRLHLIHLSISSRWSSSYITIYDGPGIESPQKRVSANITSSAFIMLLVVRTKDGNPLLPDFQPHFIRYKSTYNEMPKCAETVPSGVEENVQISIKSNFLGTERCTWNVPSTIRMLVIDDKGAVERPETLLDDEHCLYGGIYIYAKRNDEDLHEIYSKCRRRINNKPFEFIPHENTETVIAAVIFYPYSKLTDQEFIYFQKYPFPIGLAKYKTHINNCNFKKFCKAPINFPTEYALLSLMLARDSLTFHAQYIGDSDVTTRLEFHQQLAPAYTAYFTSSLCNTPPHYCNCVVLRVQYANPVSYFVPEANRAEQFFTPNKDGYETDISFASSLYINMSACEVKSYKIWWMLTFVKWDAFGIVDFKIKTANTSLPLLLNNYLEWHILQLDALLVPLQPSVWWFLLHIIGNAPVAGKQADTAAKVCIRCLFCYDIQLNVEILQQGKTESTVYDITNYPLIKGTNYTVYTQRYTHIECITGITCTTCNIIVTYRGSLRQNQTESCGCELSELGVFVRLISRERKSTSVTSLKGNPISKISER